METMVYIKRDGQNPVPVRLKTVRQNGQWLAMAEIQTRTGPVRLTAMASERTIADLIKRGAAKLPPELTTASGANIFSSIAKFAQSRAAQNVLKQAQNVVKHPLFMSALSFIPGFGPAIATVNKATQAVKAAENLMGRARQGDRKAQSSVNVIANSAKKGSKKGTVLLALLQAADGIKKMFFSGDQAREVNDVTQFGAWAPPWATSASSGNSWTPPWGGPADGPSPAQAQPQLPAPSPGPLPPSGWPQIPPRGAAQPPPTGMSAPNPSYPQAWPPMVPSGAPQMPYGWPQSPYAWPWFPRSTPKC